MHLKLEKLLAEATLDFIQNRFAMNPDSNSIIFSETNKEYEGDLTLVLFPQIKILRKSHSECGELIGNYLQSRFDIIGHYTVVQGYLNLSFSQQYWLSELQDGMAKNGKFISAVDKPKKIVLEYCGPNTNKPLHLGHLRNMVIGHSVAAILNAVGHEVHKVNIYNDRGIAICKSMQAWLLSGDGETPHSSGLKGDHLAGKYYVEYDRLLKNEIEQYERIALKGLKDEMASFSQQEQDIILSKAAALNETWNVISKESAQTLQHFMEENKIPAVDTDISNRSIPDEYIRLLVATATAFNEEASAGGETLFINQLSTLKEGLVELQEILKKSVPLAQKTREMLLKWEAGDPEVRALWNKMNSWVYDGFQITFDRLGVNFERHYKESEYYEKGKDLVMQGLEEGKFFRNADGSIGANLTPFGLDEKILIRKDGTSIYLTQDLGIAEARFDHFKMDQSIYVVADEQIYHFKALKHCLEILEKPYAQGIYHLAYGMVELPTGRMKSRQGTTVDADDLMDEMVEKAREEGRESGKIAEINEEEKSKLYELLGISAIKFFLLRINPKKRMIFDPKESIDMLGYTAAFIQYTYARIRSILRKYQGQISPKIAYTLLNEFEKDLVKLLAKYEYVIHHSAAEMDPSIIASYLHTTAKSFNRFYAECSILGNAEEATNLFRVQLCAHTAEIIYHGLSLLGIKAPDRM